jgi:hypothetical protein
MMLSLRKLFLLVLLLLHAFLLHLKLCLVGTDTVLAHIEVALFAVVKLIELLKAEMTLPHLVEFSKL